VAWNQPGPGNKDPWGSGGRRRASGPPDLDQVLRNLNNKLRGLFGGGGSGGGGGLGGSPGMNRFGFGLILGVAVVIWLLTGFYVVQQSERGVVLKFGKKTETTEAGLHWRWPWPIESVERVNVEAVSTLEIGYRTAGRDGNLTKVPREALMLTQDENIIDIEFAVQYRIKDAAAYLFSVSDPDQTVMQATESAVREVVGKSTLDFVFTEGRDQIGADTQKLLQEILDRYQAGIHIVTVKMQRAQPPEEVKAAFDDAVKAREDRDRLKNEAEAYANDVVPRARGAAGRLAQEAQGYKARVIARAEGEARRFSLVLAEYAKAPRVTRDRLYIEAMETVLSSTTKVFVDQKGGNNILYLPLDQLVNARHVAPSTGPVNTLQPLPDVMTPGMDESSRMRNRDRSDQR
jgi:membrane protease subunit HflK